MSGKYISLGRKRTIAKVDKGIVLLKGICRYLALQTNHLTSGSTL